MLNSKHVDMNSIEKNLQIKNNIKKDLILEARKDISPEVVVMSLWEPLTHEPQCL